MANRTMPETVVRFFCVEWFYTVHTAAPTRLNNLLDLVFVNDPLIMSNIEVVSPFSTSDRSVVNIDILYAKTSVTVGLDKRDKYKCFQWAQGDYDGMCRYLAERNWNDVF